MKHSRPSEFLGAQPFTVAAYPTQAELQAFFDYDPTTGSLTNKVNRGNAKAGKEAGKKLPMRSGIKDRWYRRVGFKGKAYLAHILIVILMGGAIVSGLEIDHKNGIGYDNRIENLRVVTHSQNMLNTRKHRAKAVA